MQTRNKVQFFWVPRATEKVGKDPNHTLEVEGQLDPFQDNNSVIVGVGGRIGGDNFTTLELQVAPILSDGTIGRASTRRYGSDPNHKLEVEGSVGSQEVVVGVGMRATNNNLTTLVLYGRRMNAETGLLGSDIMTYRFGRDPNHALEAEWYAANDLPAFDRTIITGIGVRVAGSTVTTLVLHTGTLIS
jgi:hypothetical protein